MPDNDKPQQVQHYFRPPGRGHFYRPEDRDYGPAFPHAPLFSHRYQITPMVMAIDPPRWYCKLPFIPRDERAPSTSRLETLPVTGGDSVTFWAGRDPSRMRLVMGFDAMQMGQRHITEELAFWRRITGPGPDKRGIRVRLNFGEAQDQAWYVEQVEVTNKDRRGTPDVVSAVVTADLVQAVNAVVAFTPAEKAAKVMETAAQGPRPGPHL